MDFTICEPKIVDLIAQQEYTVPLFKKKAAPTCAGTASL